MTPEEYCTEKVALPGSPLYYSMRRLDPMLQTVITSVCAFYKEIEDVTLDIEPEVAHTKLNWWRKEVDKMHYGKAQHPVTQALQKHLQPFTLNISHFISIIDGLEQNLCLPKFDKFEDIVVHVMRTAGTREFLLATLLQKNASLSAEIIYQFALVLELVNYLQNFKRYSQRGLIFFSHNELTHFKVKSAELTGTETTENFRKLAHHQVEKINRAYQKGLKSLSESQRQEMAPMIVRCEIALGMLRKLQAKKYNVFESFTTISPLRCWWIAWRSGVKYI